MTKEIVPASHLQSFTCPHCKAVSHQDWHDTLSDALTGKRNLPFQMREDIEEFLATQSDEEIPDKGSLLIWAKRELAGEVFIHDTRDKYNPGVIRNLHLSKCFSCKKFSVWIAHNLIWPEQNTQFVPNEDMPEEIKRIFIEASSLFKKSPRASAALLRLAIESLCNILNGKAQSVNKGIASLVKNGLNSRTQKALDIVRVTGNDAVHPGHINLNDDPEIAARLFRLVNVIVEELISLPNEIDAIYDDLPETKKDAIEKRDN